MTSPASGRVFSADVSGCRRRGPGPDGRVPRFRCQGTRGPPCFLRGGDTAELSVRFETELPLSGVVHEAYWVTGAFLLPWAGMDTDACKYLDEPCDDDGAGRRSSRRNVTLTYPMDVLEEYPPVSIVEIEAIIT